MKSKRQHYKKLLTKNYEAAHERAVASKGAAHIRKRPILLPILGLFLGIGIVATVVAAHGGQTQSTTDSHVVFLFDKHK